MYVVFLCFFGGCFVTREYESQEPGEIQSKISRRVLLLGTTTVVVLLGSINLLLVNTMN